MSLLCCSAYCTCGHLSCAIQTHCFFSEATTNAVISRNTSHLSKNVSNLAFTKNTSRKCKRFREFMNLWSFDEFFIRSTFFRRIHSSIALSFGNSLISRGENDFGIFGIFAEAKIFFFLSFVALFSRERRISVDFQWIASGFPRFQFPKFRISNFYKITSIHTYIYMHG